MLNLNTQYKCKCFHSVWHRCFSLTWKWNKLATIISYLTDILYVLFTYLRHERALKEYNEMQEKYRSPEKAPQITYPVRVSLLCLYKSLTQSEWVGYVCTVQTSQYLSITMLWQLNMNLEPCRLTTFISSQSFLCWSACCLISPYFVLLWLFSLFRFFFFVFFFFLFFRYCLHGPPYLNSCTADNNSELFEHAVK